MKNSVKKPLSKSLHEKSKIDPPQLESANYGVADSSNFKVENEKGETISPGLAVFPLLKFVEPSRWHLIGTGFFICPEGLFISAKHVLMDVFNEKEEQTASLFVFQIIPDEIYLQRPVVRCTSLDKGDVSVGSLAEMKQNSSGNLLRSQSIKLTNEIPKVGEKIHTFAYPNVVIETEKEKSNIFLNPRFYEGEIVEHFPNGRDISQLPSECFQTTMAIHGGASGGPVFDSKGRVFGINSTSLSSFPDVSFISSIRPILNLRIEGINFCKNPTKTSATIQEIIDLGFIKYE